MVEKIRNKRIERERDGEKKMMDELIVEAQKAKRRKKNLTNIGLR